MKPNQILSYNFYLNHFSEVDKCKISGCCRGVVRSSLFWDVTQRLLVVTDNSGQLIGPIFEGHAVTLHNIPEGWRPGGWQIYKPKLILILIPVFGQFFAKKFSCLRTLQ